MYGVALLYAEADVDREGFLDYTNGRNTEKIPFTLFLTTIYQQPKMATVLRIARNLTPYVLFLCSGLLLWSMYFVHNNGLATWLPSSAIIIKGKLTTATRNNVNGKQHLIDSQKKHPYELTVDKISRETYIDVHSNDKDEENNKIIPPQTDRKLHKFNLRGGSNEIYFQQRSGITELSSMFDNKDNNSLSNDSFLWKTTYQKDQKSIKVDRIVYNSLRILSNIFVQKMEEIKVKKILHYKPTCNTDYKLSNSCDNNKCLQTDLPENLTTRVAQLVTHRNLQMSQEEHEVLHGMADDVQGNYDIILLAAASSNHFFELQALLKNLHENVFPNLKNFTLIVYNLGLTERERVMIVKYCKCQVLDFPFEKFPHFMAKLKCYNWKPVLIKAHLQNANVVFWMDASIRFHNSSSHFQSLIRNTRERGAQIGGSSAESTYRTYRSMYHFFGDEPCAYVNLGQAKATFGVFHREHFVDRVILEPWVACALNKDCMCPNPNLDVKFMDKKFLDRERCQVSETIPLYGLCHRHDQSAISLIIHKLYQDQINWIMIRADNVLDINRREKLVYFPEELNSKTSE